MKKCVVDLEKAVWLDLKRCLVLTAKYLDAGFIGRSVYFAVK